MNLYRFSDGETLVNLDEVTHVVIEDAEHPFFPYRLSFYFTNKTFTYEEFATEELAIKAYEKLYKQFKAV